MRGPYYKDFVHSLKKQYNWTCSKCGYKAHPKDRCNILVHHKDSNPSNNHPDNLEVICDNCHAKIHGWKK